MSNLSKLSQKPNNVFEKLSNEKNSWIKEEIYLNIKQGEAGQKNRDLNALLAPTSFPISWLLNMTVFKKKRVR